MLESAADFHARVLASTDAERRLPVAMEDTLAWDIFPFEAASLRYKPLQDPAPELPRRGEDPAECWCAAGEPPWANIVWSDDDWLLSYDAKAQLPCQLVLQPREHCDLPTVPPRLHASMGALITAVSAGVESLPSVGRSQLAKWGDGGAHLHLVFLGRPAEMLQLRGSPLLDWADSLPVVPEDVLLANARQVAGVVAERCGGTVRA